MKYTLLAHVSFIPFQLTYNQIILAENVTYRVNLKILIQLISYYLFSLRAYLRVFRKNTL